MIKSKYSATITDKPWWLAGGIPRQNGIAAYQPKGASSQAASYVNLATPGLYDCTVGNAPAWAVTTGWTFDGTDDYLVTGVIPEADQTWSMIAKFSGVSKTKGLIGAEVGTNGRFYIFPRRGSADDFLLGNGGYIATGVRLTSGILAVAGVNGYLNGIHQGVMNATWGGTPGIIIIGALNHAAPPDVTVNLIGEYCDGVIPAMAIYDIDISPYITAITNAIDAI